jgi:hypothetical protein
MLLASAVFFVLFFSISFTAKEFFDPIYVPFSIALPCFAIFQIFVSVDVDETRIANLFCVGGRSFFEWKRVDWKDVKEALIYHSDNSSRINLRLVKTDGSRWTFAAPKTAPVADNFIKLEKTLASHSGVPPKKK